MRTQEFGGLPCGGGSWSNIGMPRRPLALCLLSLSLSLFAFPQSASRTEFVRMVTEFSEPDGYFDTDNLISNETTYLDAAAALREMEGSGGIYVGVGPDQNFSYIAHLRPNLAFLVDIRRGNLLEHLLFRALFEQARNRMEYLCLLLGKPVPSDLEAWNSRPISKIAAYLDEVPAKKDLFERTSAEVRRRAAGFGLALSEGDVKTMAGFHQRFFDDGLDLRFNTHGREPQPYYPKFRDLILARGASGAPESYLANEELFGVVKKMQMENRMIPIVGNLAGSKALRSIGAYAHEKSLVLRAFYTSNVEQYLGRGGDLNKFAENVKSLPRDAKSLIIRSSFGYYSRRTSGSSYSEQLIQPVEEFTRGWDAGRLGSYRNILEASRPALRHL